MSIGFTNKEFLLIVLVVLLSTSIGCTTVAVDRVNTTETVDLTDRWNDTDSRLVAEEMIGDMLEFPWIRNYQQRTGNARPTVIIQHISNWRIV